MIAAVSGANGFVGSHLVDLLIEKGFQVKALVRESSNTRWLDGKPVILERCGLHEADKLKQVFSDVDYVFHIAGVVSAKTEEGFFNGNVKTTKNVLEAALHCPQIKRIVVTSSLAAAGPTAVGKPLDEEAPLNPINAYGFSKQAQEELCNTYVDQLPITIIRPPAVFGERDTELYIFFNTVRKGLFTKVGFGEKSLSMVHVKDLVQGVLSAGQFQGPSGEVFFLGSDPSEYSWDQIGEISSRLLKKKPITLSIPHGVVYLVGAISGFIGRFQRKHPTINWEKAKEIVQPSWSCSSEKAMNMLDYRPEKSLEERMEETFQWYSEQGWF